MERWRSGREFGRKQIEENYERLLPKWVRKFKEVSTNNAKLHSHNNRAWENERLNTSFQNTRRSNVSMRKTGTENWSQNIYMRTQTKEREREYKEGGNVCIYVYKYKCVVVCIYVYIYVWIYVFLFVRIIVITYVHLYYVLMYECMCVCMYVWMYMYEYIYVYVYVYN